MDGLPFVAAEGLKREDARLNPLTAGLNREAAGRILLAERFVNPGLILPSYGFDLTRPPEGSAVLCLGGVFSLPT